MKTNNLLTFLEKQPYFTTEAFKQMVEPISDSRYVATTLYRWMKTGKIIQLKKGVYMPRRFFELHNGDEDFSPAVSAVILPQSYISLEYVLQKNSTLTEVTYPVSAITLKNTRVIENQLGTFSYRHIKKEYYLGFSLREYFGLPFAMASKAKALFDFLYFRPLSEQISDIDFDLAADQRLNLHDFTTEDRQEFSTYIEQSESQKMNAILKNLRKSIWRP